MKPHALPLSVVVAFISVQAAHSAVITCDNINTDPRRTGHSVAGEQTMDLRARAELLENIAAHRNGSSHLRNEKTSRKSCQLGDCGMGVLEQYRKYFGDGSAHGIIAPGSGSQPHLPATPKPGKNDGNIAELPEPSAWSLALAGMLLAGFARRHNRRAAR